MNQTKAKKFIIDAADRSVGRVATQAATILIGKNSPDYIPNLDNTNKVIINNVDKVKYTGKKLEQKIYFHYSGFPGGMKSKQLKEMAVKNPQKVMLLAISRMLPKNKLRTPRLKRVSFK